MAIRHGDFVRLIRQQPLAHVLLAIESVRTQQGAVNIYGAESEGLRRPSVLRAAERRLEQLRGTEAPGSRTQLVVAGAAVETASLNSDRPRIVAAVGRGRKHPGW